MLRFKFFKSNFIYQLESTDCGAACLTMLVNHYGKKVSLTQIKSLFEFTRIGVSIQDIVFVSQKIGLESIPIKLKDFELSEIPLPSILYWKQDHFVVLKKIIKKKEKLLFSLSDPSYGDITLDLENFSHEWKGANEKGIAIVIQPKKKFKLIELPEYKNIPFYKSEFFNIFISYFKNHKLKYLFASFLILISLITNWFIPFVFQKIIDLGINQKSLNIVYYLLLAQLTLFISNFLSDFFSNVFLIKINFNLGISLKKKLLQKLIKLPINYFDILFPNRFSVKII